MEGEDRTEIGEGLFLLFFHPVGQLENPNCLPALGCVVPLTVPYFLHGKGSTLTAIFIPSRPLLTPTTKDSEPNQTKVHAPGGEKRRKKNKNNSACWMKVFSSERKKNKKLGNRRIDMSREHVIEKI